MDETRSQAREHTERLPAPLVWDLPVRLFHWLLVLTLAGSWLTHELGVRYMEWHMRFGYAAIALVAFRVMWGFAGPRHARFSSFLSGPAAAVGYAREWLAGRAGTRAGHNPLGGWAVVAMLLLVAVQAVSGLFNTDDILSSGPWRSAVPGWFADRMSWLHGTAFNLLLALVCLHFTAIAAYWFRLRINLTGAMITGRRSGLGADAAIASQRLLLALVLAVASAAAVWLLIALAPEPSATDLLF